MVNEALKLVYQSISDRYKISFEDFELLMQGWEVIPLEQNGELLGAVITKGPELHVGYGIKPQGSIMKHIKATLVKLIDKYGFAVTTVESEYAKGLRFCKRLGFVEIAEKNGKIYLKCNKIRYK
jgi:hypothetical protein